MRSRVSPAAHIPRFAHPLDHKVVLPRSREEERTLVCSRLVICLAQSPSEGAEWLPLPERRVGDTMRGRPGDLLCRRGEKSAHKARHPASRQARALRAPRRRHGPALLRRDPAPSPLRSTFRLAEQRDTDSRCLRVAVRTHAHAHTRAHTHGHAHVHTHVHTCANTQGHMHTCTCACIHVRARTHKDTHAHTDTPPGPPTHRPCRRV